MRNWGRLISWRSRAPRRWRGGRYLMYGAVGAMLAIALVESFVTFGLVVPVRVEGDSMSPTLHGPHALVTCPHCQWQFAVGSDQVYGPRPLLCSDCRSEFAPPPQAIERSGRRVVINRLEFLGRDPGRWEIVVLRHPEKQGTYCVKRVVGLPGESLEFRRGDLYVDGELVRKELPHQLELRQLVHRERDSHRLWESHSGHWQWHEGSWRHSAPEPSLLQLVPPAGQPITDDLATNQQVTRQLHLVSDLMITCRVSTAPGARLVARAVSLGEHAEASIPLPAGKADSRELLVSWFDQQLIVAIDGKVVERHVSLKPWPLAPRLELEASGEVTITQLEVWRDVYYHLRPGDLHPWPEETVPAGHCFVVGDNVAISSDSRTWEGLGVDLKNLVGGLIGD